MNTGYSPDELQIIYARRFTRMLECRNRIWRVLTGRFFQKHVHEKATVLDLGCGYGEFINNIKASEKFGMDLNPDASRHLHPDVKLLAQDCSARWALNDNSLDVVFTSNFFEHLPDKSALGRTLAEAHRCLKSGGQLIAMGPNIRYLPGAYWDFWDHHLPLTELSLAEGLENCGFDIALQKGRFLPYTMSRGRPPGSIHVFLLNIYLHIEFLWRFLGTQFLVIARKK